MAISDDILSSHLYVSEGMFPNVTEELVKNKEWAEELFTTGSQSFSQFNPDVEDLRDNEGRIVVPVYKTFTAMEFLYPSEWENTFNPLRPFGFAIWFEWMPWVLSAAYVILVFGGQRLMKNSKPYDLRVPLIAWNAFLSIFSIIGAFRTVPHLIRNIMAGGLHYSMCAAAEPAYGVGATGLWVMLFIYSKPVELFDTAFIVLRKKNLILLHWYHHITVMLYAWYSYKLKNAAGLWFIAMNYSVHAVMYCYYALVAAKQKPKWDFIVTAMQISQMVVGVMVCVMVPYYAHFHEHGCRGMTDFSYAAGVIMYASYLILFVMLAVRRYCLGGKGSLTGMGQGKNKNESKEIKDAKGKSRQDASPEPAVQNGNGDADGEASPSEEPSSEEDIEDVDDEEEEEEEKPKKRASSRKPRSARKRRSSRVNELLQEATQFQETETQMLRRRAVAERHARAGAEDDDDEGDEGEAGWGGAAEAGPIEEHDRRPVQAAPQRRAAGAHRPVTRSQSRGRIHP